MMIVSHTYRFGFVSVPKCGTNTLYQYLPQYFDGIKVGTGFHGHEQLETLPKGYLVFSVRRNPYSRIVSYWASTTQRGDDRYAMRADCAKDGKSPDIFHEWVQWVVDAKPEMPIPQHQFVRPFYDRVQAWLRVEHLEDDFQQLGVTHQPIPPMPMLNETFGRDRQHWRDYYLPETWDLVNAWAGADFDIFGYPRITATCLAQ